MSQVCCLKGGDKKMAREGSEGSIANCHPLNPSRVFMLFYMWVLLLCISFPVLCLGVWSPSRFNSNSTISELLFPTTPDRVAFVLWMDWLINQTHGYCIHLWLPGKAGWVVVIRHALKQWFSTRGDLPLGTSVNIWKQFLLSFGFHTCGEAPQMREAATHSTVHGTAPPNKEMIWSKMSTLPKLINAILE